LSFEAVKADSEVVRLNGFSVAFEHADEGTRFFRAQAAIVHRRRDGGHSCDNVLRVLDCRQLKINGSTVTSWR
jgi:hypothetical protein